MLQFRILPSISYIKGSVWDACANQGEVANDPFVSHAFLYALEASGSATRDNGWISNHLIAEDQNQNVVGVVPMYIKTHSQGEFVFDQGWARAFHLAGRQYYPKLQISVPFTPVTGSRLLVSEQNLEYDSIQRQLLQACISVIKNSQQELSSAHLTFVPEEQAQLALELGWLPRIDYQFYWFNKDYSSFDDFLQELASKKRKNFKRERRDAVVAGIDILWLTGADIKEHHWDAFFSFYMETGLRKWGRPYLTRKFFSMIGESMAANILLILCVRKGKFIAGALHFIGSGVLYGRYWGCIEQHKFLHFETCYYQAIDFAIAHKLSRVEAGAQGLHKLVRGYVPKLTFSAHLMRDEDAHKVISNYLQKEREETREQMHALGIRNPFKAV